MSESETITAFSIPKFVQIHTLHSYPAALLNRDDTGLAKRMPFGGAIRTRVSSQARKRRWRMAQDYFNVQNVPGVEAALRSRNVVERLVMQPIRDAGAASEETLAAVTTAFNRGVYGSSGDAESGRQLLLLGLPEVEYLRAKATAICEQHPHNAAAAEIAAADLFSARRGEGANFAAFRANAKLPGGIVGALFGRMVTSDPAANIDAAIHVGHAFTVHPEESESDFFTAVDDLKRDDEDAGAGHIGDAELSACLLYGYVAVDIPMLVSNISGYPAAEWTDAPDADREIASGVVEYLTHLIATITPGAKLGGTAPYAFADLVLIEAGARQPRSLANAYRAPCPARMDAATNALAQYLGKVDAAYGRYEARKFTSIEDFEVPYADRIDIGALAKWAGGWARGPQAATAPATGEEAR